MNTHTIYADKSLLTILFCSIILLLLCPSNKYPLHHIVLSFCSSSACSIVLLCFCLLYRSALLLLLYRSALLLLSSIILLYFYYALSFFSPFHLILYLLSNVTPHIFFLLLHSFSLQNSSPTQFVSSPFIHASTTFQLPNSLGKLTTTNLQS